MEINKRLNLTFAVGDMQVHCEPLNFAQCNNHIILLSCLKKMLNKCAAINDFAQVAYPFLLKLPKTQWDSIEDGDVAAFISDITRGVNFVVKGDGMPVHWDIMMLRNEKKPVLTDESINEIYSKLIFFILDSYFKMLTDQTKAFAAWSIGAITSFNIMEFISSCMIVTTTDNSGKKVTAS